MGASFLTPLGGGISGHSFGEINNYDDLISLENLFLSWQLFKKGKSKRKDVLEFEFWFEDNLFLLYQELKSKTYKHAKYSSFYVQDPKLRRIHKAEVRDRIVHHLISKYLEQIYDKTFIFDSYSCRLGKGTHKAVDRLQNFIRKVSKNNTVPCFVLKCDIKKFFDSIDHKNLADILKRKIRDKNILNLAKEIINSFPTENNKGIPLGNLTSQHFANIYLNEFDQFVKHQLKVKYYIRYTDDFVIVASDELYLKSLIAPIRSFLADKLALELHPKKVVICKFHQGVDYLGYKVLPHYQLLRTKTKKRIFRKLEGRVEEYKKGLINRQSLEQFFQSYLGILTHTDAYKLEQKLRNQFWFWLGE